MTVSNKLVEILKENADVEGKNRIDVVFADVLSKHKCPTLHLEWMIEKLWGTQFNKYVIPYYDRVYDFLVKNKHNQKNKFDLHDQEIWFERSKEDKVFCHTTQNHNFVYIKQHNYFLHIRRFWHEYKLDPKDKFEVEDDNFFKKEAEKRGMEIGIQFADALSCYADDFHDNEFVHRPSIKYFRKNKFSPLYQDHRDLAYVATLHNLSGEIRGAFEHHTLLKLILTCYFPNIVENLLREKIEIHEGVFESWAKG